MYLQRGIGCKKWAEKSDLKGKRREGVLCDVFLAMVFEEGADLLVKGVLWRGKRVKMVGERAVRDGGCSG
jgi:hypothetical protein